MKRKDNVFASTAMQSVESNQFDLSHDKKFTCNMGELVPVLCMEVLPGDKFSMSAVNMLRFLPLIAPVMHKVKVITETFFVPIRILYGGWEGFITGTDSLTCPYVRLDDVVPKGSLADYLGIPAGDYADVTVRVSPFQAAAYLKIYDDWYRDQNLIPEQYHDMIPGDNSSTYAAEYIGEVRKRAWEHDYFTSCLPTTQQGTEVSIPITTQTGIPVELDPSGVPFKVKQVSGANMNGPAALSSAAGTSDLVAAGTGAILDPEGNLVVDIAAGAASINDLRRAFSLQSFLERSIRGGLRYIEQIYSHFQVKSSDARLQRPEMIGRSVQNMTIGEVLATAQSSNDGATAEIPVGSMAGHGISVGGSDGMSYYAEEHGFIMTMISIVPDTAYQDGLAKSFTRFDRLDYAFPEFAHIGEQPVLIKELRAAVSTGVDPDAVFGYLPRYSEYRYHPSMVAGDFRDSLAYWTLARIFDNPAVPPALNQQFIECSPRLDIFAVTDPDVDHVIGQIFNKITVSRKLPRYGVPSSI